MPDEPSSQQILISELATDSDMVELVEMFVSELPERIASLEQALQQQAYDQVSTLAHQLKGSGGGYGFPAITEAARKLEATVKTDQDLEKMAAELSELADVCRRARAVPENG